MENRICKKCLLRDSPESEKFQNMFEYIRGLDEEIKAPEVLYQERLKCCKECDRLLSGVCNACGCFVEMRAAVKNNACPYKKW